MTTPTTGSTLGNSYSRIAQPEHIEITILSEPAMLAIIGGQAPQIPSFTLGDLVAKNAAFVKLLEDLRMAVLENGIDLTEHGRDFISEFRDLGKDAFATVAKGHIQKAVQNIEAQNANGISLTIRTPAELSFYWEMLYDDAEEQGLFGEVKLDRFWGFRYPLGRAYMLPDYVAKRELSMKEGVFSAIHTELPQTIVEIDKLRKFLLALRPEGSNPLDLRLLHQLKEFGSVKVLLEHLLDSGPQYGILHFACHCEKRLDGSASDTSLIFSRFDSEDALPLSLLNSVGGSDRFFLSGHPFVFLNACDSRGGSRLFESTDFPKAFLSIQAGSVIATACTIPDDFASKFAVEFYRRLLHLSEEGITMENQPTNAETLISVALLKTRLYFLEKYNNPLGLAYGMYAQSNQVFSLHN